jgi:vancomycin resistance protein YoaR
LGETEQQMAVRRYATVGGIAAAGLVAVLLVTMASLWVVQRDRTLPNTSIAGIDVSRMTEGEVRTAIQPTVTQRESEPIVFVFEDDRYPVVPQEVGFRIDVDGTVEQALSRGRTGLPGDVVERVRSLRTSRDIDFEREVDATRTDAWISDLAADLDREVSNGSVTIDPDTLEVTTELPHDGVAVRQDETNDLLVEALLTAGSPEIEVPADITPRLVPDADVRAVSQQAERAVAAPLELTSGDASLTLERGDVARLIDVVVTSTGAESATLELVVTATKVDEVMGEVAEGRFERSPVDAGFSADRRPPRGFDASANATFEPIPASVAVEEGRDGAQFDSGLAATQLTELLRMGARAAELRLEVVEAELTTERAKELRPTHLLGTFTTYYQAGADRNKNIQRLADEVDGALVLPGEQFSINAISGERSCSKGYVEAGTIVRGELVDTCGGGVSQFGTTTFNAAFFAGVQLDEWKAHSWYISRYPMGREATLTFPTLDVKFTNTTDGAILVKTAHTDTSVTVSLYGQPIAKSVTATHGQPTQPRDFSTDIRTTSELYTDQERVIQGGAGGFTVEVVRTVNRTDGSTDRRTITTVYVPQTRIIERGTRPRPAPEPSPPPADEA